LIIFFPEGSFYEKQDFIFTPNLSFFDVKPHAKFRNPTITPSGRKECGGEKNKLELTCAKLRSSWGYKLRLFILYYRFEVAFQSKMNVDFHFKKKWLSFIC
jgi:hypothetical protein